MKLRYKILSGVTIVITLAVTTLAITLSYNADCQPATANANFSSSMKAVIYQCYGTADVLQIAEIEKPTPAANEVLVKIQAASVNPLDWHYMHGSPYIMRLGTGVGAPKNTRLGVDFSGTVEAVGQNVTHFKVGDAVFGGRTGAFAEYVTIAEDRAITIKPENISFAQAAAVPIAGVTALQALRDSGKLQAGQQVLINGASGGVGTFAVQIAKALGAEVTGVCSERNIAMVQKLGADHVINYKTQDYTRLEQRYDLIVDLVGNHSPLENNDVLKAGGKLVIIGGGKGNWMGPFSGALQAMIVSNFVDQEMAMMLADLNPADLKFLGELMQSGKMAPVIDRRYPFEQSADAVRYQEKGHASGKVIIEMGAE